MPPVRAIFISGGASGIGRAVAVRFAAGGWFVGLGDIDAAGMAGTLALLGEGRGWSRLLDVRDAAQWDDVLAAFAEAAGGRIDAVFNNAGVPLGGPLAEMTEAEIDRCLGVNLKGALLGARAAYPWLRASAPGSCLLSTSSAAGIWGTPGAAVYSATKFAVRAMTESLDADWAADGIRVADLMPAFIDTPLLDHTSHAGSNAAIRAEVSAAGLEITPVDEVAETAWRAVHGTRLHWPVGKTAVRLTRAARWFPGALRKQLRRGLSG
ncbi:SDR family oxidoreductase [Parablastomonas sp. CN1-191]|uniref:SDR family oxidoreductase n=1 Tax=Parablastomonas sp. CN1-191 TaxID=3400908 RepID=UPI003BF806E4